MKQLDRLFRIMAFGGAFATLALPPLIIGSGAQGPIGLILLCTTVIAIVGFIGLVTLKKRNR